MHYIFVYYCLSSWIRNLEKKSTITVCDPAPVSSAVYGLSLINLCLAAVSTTLKINV